MSATALKETVADDAPRVDRRPTTTWGAIRKVLMPLASLKLTLVLFALSIFLVFTSTLAQKELDVWDVIEGWYRVDERLLFTDAFPFVNPSELFVRIPLNLANILDKTLVPDWVLPSVRPLPEIPGALWFPRGWLLGLLMGINLLAAHTVRFTVQGKGKRLYAGLGILALGMVATFMAIESGASREGILSEAVISWPLLWKLLLLGLTTAAFFGGVAFFKMDPKRKFERYAIGLSALGCAAMVAAALSMGSAAQFDPESMRILWQLLKGTGAGLVLLAGCHLVFNKRAGIVLLHGGVGLIFLYEVIVGTSHEEAQMSVFEGTKSNWTHDVRTGELAITQRGTDGKDIVAAIPQKLFADGKSYDLPNMPLEVRIVKFFRNSDVRDLRKGETTQATAGMGKNLFVEELKPASGVDARQTGDVASALVEVREKGPGGKSLGTFLTSQLVWNINFQNGLYPPDTFKVGDKEYAIELRYKRTYKPYVIEVKEVRKDDYLAGDTPRNYSSLLHVVDKTRGIDREEPIKMNSPMRFAGETFYQSGYNVVDGKKMTTISVVENHGWMLPYVSCMIVAIGMLAQFGITLSRFLQRRRERATAPAIVAASDSRKKDRKAARNQSADEAVAPAAPSSWTVKWLPWAGVAFVVVMAAYTAKPPRAEEGEMDFYAFGKLPVAYESRVKPFDSMARSTLSYLSHRQTTKKDPGDRSEKSKSATQWLLDVITDADVAHEYPVFRIDNLDTLKELGLERSEFSRYSVNDLRPAFEKLTKQLDLIKAKKTDLEPFEREIDKLHSRIQKHLLVYQAFLDPDLTVPTEEEKEKDPQGLEKRLLAQLQHVALTSQQLKKAQPPLAVPKGNESWEAYIDENMKLFLAKLMYKDKAETAPDFNPAAEKFHNILTAYKKNDAKAFNEGVADYRAYLAAHPPKEYDPGRRDLEAYLNAADPFFWASWLYLVGGVVALLAWLGGLRSLNRTAAFIIVTTLIYHTAAGILRIYVTGRPPVTNLYSSAVFIGWGAVVLGMILESVYKMGVGNVVAAVAGFGSLQIAYLLTRQGDHIESLQAVLDTQFWLTTHVTCITLGYATTYLAGLFGAAYIVQGLFTKSLSSSFGKELTRMTYGTLCFALFFSFVGTVLGGLWADDSWGRFWGWDPKENGALIIVLWNALVLHARWDGIAKDRGLAILAVAGNITTSWSWFGVNQLGVGLHAYGFSQDLLNVLFWFVTGSAAIAALGSLPTSWWRSREQLRNAA